MDLGIQEMMIKTAMAAFGYTREQARELFEQRLTAIAGAVAQFDRRLANIERDMALIASALKVSQSADNAATMPMISGTLPDHTNGGGAHAE